MLETKMPKWQTIHRTFLIICGFAGISLFYCVVLRTGYSKFVQQIGEKMTWLTTDDQSRYQGLSDLNSTWNSLESFRSVQRRRIEHIRDVCADRNFYLNQTYRGKPNLLYYFSPEYNFSYCKVPKVGCSFWTQVFTILREGEGVTKEVFDMSRKVIHRKLSSHFTTRFNSKERRASHSILISRNPYSRLFSAFVDKIFLQQFRSSAVRIVKRQRRIAKSEFSCVGDITFQEFLEDVVETASAGKSLNRHWAPIVSLCSPCNVNAFSLIKQESFSTDVEYTLRELRIAEKEFQAIYDALYDHRVDTTVSSLIKAFEAIHRSRNKECLTKVELVKKIWISFQIQGYLKDDIPFPSDIITTEENANSLNLTVLILKTIRNNPMTSQDRETQRSQALVGAFNKVDEKTIKAIKNIYKQDFILFNYSFDPPAKQKFDSYM